MNPQRLTQAEKQELDQFCLKHPELWQLGEYLPLVRRTGNRYCDLQAGVVWLHENPVDEDRVIIRICNVHKMPETVAEWKRLEKYEYSSPAKVIEANWCVD